MLCSTKCARKFRVLLFVLHLSRGILVSRKKTIRVVLDWVKEQRFDRLGVFAYSHEENTHAYNFEDDVPAEVKQQRVDEVMALQMAISRDLNEQKIGLEYRVLVDRKEGNYFVGRTEFDSPDVDNEVLIPAEDIYLKIGDFCQVKIVEAHDYDLIGQVID
jgi:ribosomal protein S12 methylthiotransferase